MFAYFIFTASIAGIFLILRRRYILTKKDIALQHRVLKEEHSPKEPNADIHRMHKKVRDVTEMHISNRRISKSMHINNLFKKADLYAGRGMHEQAVQLLMKIISIDENHLEANKKLGYIYLKQGDYVKAEFIFKKLIGIRDEAGFFSHLGLAYYHQYKLKEAAEAYEHAIQKDRMRVERYASLGHVYHELKLFDKALDCFEKALKISPRNIEYMLIVGGYYDQKHNFEKARKFYETVLKHDPYNEEALEKIETMP